MVKLSVCIPSRNRQKYCIETIKSLAKSDQQNIEFIIGDNSDDPEIMINFFKTFDDPRFKFLPSENRVLSMVENWNRLPSLCCGEWIMFIGDDDYVDPELSDFLTGLEEKVPDVDSLAWNSMTFNWPDVRQDGYRINMPITCGVYTLSKEIVLRRVFYWEDATDRITANPGIYHAVQKRDLLESVKATFGGQYFVHQEVDYEAICKTALLAQKMVVSQRPFSVMGACKASNSAAIIDPQKYKKLRHDTFEKELQDSNVAIKYPSDFPFERGIGLTASIGALTLWMIQEYELDVRGWEKNFVKACKNFCEASGNVNEFKKRKREFGKAIRKWQDGAYMAEFRPNWKGPRQVYKPYQGYYKGALIIDPDINGASTPGEAFEALKCVLPTPRFMLQNIQIDKEAA